MPFSDPVTSLPASSIEGEIPSDRIAGGNLPNSYTVNGNLIVPGANGRRIEMGINGTRSGIRLYDHLGNIVTELDANTGSGTFSGRIKGAVLEGEFTTGRYPNPLVSMNGPTRTIQFWLGNIKDTMSGSTVIVDGNAQPAELYMDVGADVKNTAISPIERRSRYTVASNCESSNNDGSILPTSQLELYGATDRPELGGGMWPSLTMLRSDAFQYLPTRANNNQNNGGTATFYSTLDVEGQIRANGGLHLNKPMTTVNNADGNITVGAGAHISSPFFRARFNSFASSTSTTHGFQAGPDSSTNTRLGGNGIQAMNNGAIATLNLNPSGGDVIASRIEVRSGSGASLTSTAHGYQAGLDTAANIRMGGNSIQAANNGAVASLVLNPSGGDINCGTNSRVIAPKSLQSGVRNLDAVANTLVTVGVTFPVAFNTAPRVVVSPITAVNSTQTCAPSSVTTTGFNITVFRTTTQNMDVHWIATTA